MEMNQGDWAFAQFNIMQEGKGKIKLVRDFSQGPSQIEPQDLEGKPDLLAQLVCLSLLSKPPLDVLLDFLAQSNALFLGHI